MLVLAGLAAAQAGAGTLLRDAGVVPEPARYSELAFADPATLPDTLPAGDSQLVLPIRIGNHEGARTRYRWTVGTARGGATASGEAWVPDGRATRITPTVAVTCSGRRDRLEVRVWPGDLTVGAWIDCEGGERG